MSGARYATITFAELDTEAIRLARGLVDWGVPTGARLALLVRPGIEFVALVFALLRAGAVIVLVDSGLGKRRAIRALAEIEPDGFVAVPLAQCARALLQHRLRLAKWNVTVGRSWGSSGLTLAQLAARGDSAEGAEFPETSADDPAAIVFTSGSTGPAKGVLYTHQMFDTQVTEIQSTYRILPGGVDLSCFPLFALFNTAMGVTTVLPDIDFSRPAAASPVKLITAADDWQVTQAFASPAVWKRLSRFCALSGQQISSLRQVFSCGAPVTGEIVEATLESVAPNAQMHTPYGATECLPVATFEAVEILRETSEAADRGEGICVGKPFNSIEWRVIRLNDGPISSIDVTEELPMGEIGELIVRGPQASAAYVARPEHNAAAKIREGDGFWHRMGDVGYLDTCGRFWYCGRKSHRVETACGTLFTECVEAIFNTHDDVERTALVGVGPRGKQTPVLFVEPTQALRRRHGSDWSPGEYQSLLHELRAIGLQYERTRQIAHFLLHKSLPVDVRHNVKIYREQLARLAARRVPEPR
jgi:acyl-CoA synthetase (AMP-forming)/AMP-acid ligase II